MQAIVPAIPLSEFVYVLNFGKCMYTDGIVRCVYVIGHALTRHRLINHYISHAIRQKANLPDTCHVMVWRRHNKTGVDPIRKIALMKKRLGIIEYPDGDCFTLAPLSEASIRHVMYGYKCIIR